MFSTQHDVIYYAHGEGLWELCAPLLARHVAQGVAWRYIADEPQPSQAADALANGARVVCGGARLTGGGYDGGYFFPPTVIADADHSMMEDAASYGVSRGAIKRAAHPDDMAGAALFLASPASDFITGQTLTVDGGRQFI